MASVATAAAQPGVSVVSMSWGFPEGQSVFAADEATYDSVFNVPGVTFVASTGDYGAADPEYPAFSPNVVAVGGTSLTLNADNSYNSETGWGYYSELRGRVDRLGRRDQPVRARAVVPAGRAVHRLPDHAGRLDGRRSGHRRLDRRPVQPGPEQPVRGRGRHEPVGAGLGGPGGPGQPGAGGRGRIDPEQHQPDRDPAGPLQPAAGDYNVITSGNNGYTANAGYNLVTGLGTPVANLLVPDLIAYQGPGTTYAGPTVGPLQDATLSDTGDGRRRRDRCVQRVRCAGRDRRQLRAPTRGTGTAGVAVASVSSRDGNHLAPFGATALPEPADVPTVRTDTAAAAVPASDTGATGMMPLADLIAAHDAAAHRPVLVGVRIGRAGRRPGE